MSFPGEWPGDGPFTCIVEVGGKKMRETFTNWNNYLERGGRRAISELPTGTHNPCALAFNMAATQRVALSLVQGKSDGGKRRTKRRKVRRNKNKSKRLRKKQRKTRRKYKKRKN